MPGPAPASNANQSEKQVNYGHSLIAAGISGFVGAYASFIFEGTKKRLQSNQPLPSLFKLGAAGWMKELFRGSSSFAGSLVPTSMLQQMTSHFFASQNLSTTTAGKIAETAFSGALGGFASTLVENTILRQQMNKSGPLAAISSLLKEGKTRPFRGLPLIMTREAIFTLCYLKGAKDAGDYAVTHFGAAYVLPAQLAIGTVGSLASHPFDTTATTMQRYGYTSPKQAAAHLWKENGTRAFMKGALARVGLFNVAMLSISKTQAFVMEKLAENDSPKMTGPKK